ncbi:anther-specific protein BCP1-like [Chenopodium quinoa]|uniref:anther-specific protein BCP1-like n=1 Tax=Chenopodium quinoa TaxID=63459 RepID=UPI000B789C25|nr:anther-specific protein BCP1-like [Chenopodium quinoa]
MAKKVAALVFFALLGLAFAEAAIIPKTTTAPSPSEDIGNEGGDVGSPSGGFAEAGPVGGPVPAGMFPDTPTDPSTDGSSPTKKNGASKLEVSTIAGVTLVGFSLFYF